MKLTKEQIKKLANALNPHINLPKVPELIEGWILRVIISIIDMFLWKKLPEDIYTMYKDLVLMLVEGSDNEKAEAKEEILAHIPSEYLRV